MSPPRRRERLKHPQDCKSSGAEMRVRNESEKQSEKQSEKESEKENELIFNYTL